MKKKQEKMSDKDFTKILYELSEDIKPSESFKRELKDRLMSKLEGQEQEPKQNFWGRVLKPLVFKPSFQAVFASLLIIFVATALLMKQKPVENDLNFNQNEIKRFSSIAEYEQYLLSSNFSSGYGDSGYMAYGSLQYRRESLLDIGSAKAGRTSGTNIQVKGIDEGDILKTDGSNIYLSSSYIFDDLEDYYSSSNKKDTKIIKAFPASLLSAIGKINKSGDLLLHDDTLIIFSEKSISGYDVSNPKRPAEKWTLKIEHGTRVTDIRMKDGKIYFVTNTSIGPGKASNAFLNTDDGPVDITYSDIYYPGIQINADSTYTVSSLNPDSGNIENKVSFVGSSNESVVYMSNNSIYLTYSYTDEVVNKMADFMENETKHQVPEGLTQAIRRLATYKLIDGSKRMELNAIFEAYSEDTKTEKIISKLLTEFYKKKIREIERTGIVKIGLPSLNIESSGKVPGHPLNQFALDEYQGHLRIATTIGQQFYELSYLADEPESANDVYVLDNNLRVTGSIKNLGLTEEVYSARFINDKAYVVTFRETDPFYVLDLANPAKPKLKGELKIPGYSSYLHPMSNERVLGVGMEDDKVKVQLFDVSSPSKPTVLSKLILDEYWSETLTNHHAFLNDDKYKVFFVPGEKTGYVVSYANDKLRLKKAVEGISPRRAVYLNDYLYIVGDKQITVVDENSWKKVNQLDLK